MNRFAPDNITRLPDSPRQDGNNSILSFQAVLPSGRTFPRFSLASIFVAKREEIFSVESILENQEDTIPQSERKVLNENTVAIELINFPVSKVSYASLSSVLEVQAL